MTGAGHRRRRAVPGRVMLSTIAAVALLGVIPGAAAADWKSGTYSDTTSQGKTFSLDVTQKKVNVTFFGFTAPPCGGEGGLQFAGLQAKIKSTGRFKAVFGDYGYVKGRLKGRNASGTALYHFDSEGCNSGEVTWTAHKG